METGLSRAKEHVLPAVIQGGMGVGVSSWQLARSVSRAGGLGVVSGTALDLVLARRLQDGDPSGDERRALAAFPDQAMARRVLDLYFQPEGRPVDDTGRPRAYRPVPKHMYARKGGDVADTAGRACLCNALTADVGLGQTRRDGSSEPALVTLGSDLSGVQELAACHLQGWTGADVVAWLTAG